MLGVCDMPKGRKKGMCSDCGVCRCCEPVPACRIQSNNINWMRIAKRTGIMIDQPNQLVMQRTANRSPKRTPRRGKRKSNMRGKKRRIVDFDLHDDFELFSFSPDVIEIPTPLGIRCNEDMGI
jgi:hypothetical protein